MTEEELGRDHASLVIHSHQKAKKHIEYNPDSYPNTQVSFVFRKLNRREHQRNGWEKEARFLMLEDGEHENAGYCRVQTKGQVWLREEEDEGRAEELWEIARGVLVIWVNAMLCEIAGC